MPRRLSLFLLASMLGGGWFYFGGDPSQLKSFVGQQQAGYNSPVAATNNFSAAPFTTGAPAAPTPVPLHGGPTIRIASFNIQVFGDEKASVCMT